MNIISENHVLFFCQTFRVGQTYGFAPFRLVT